MRKIPWKAYLSIPLWFCLSSIQATPPQEVSSLLLLEIKGLTLTKIYLYFWAGAFVFFALACLVSSLLKRYPLRLGTLTCLFLSSMALLISIITKDPRVFYGCRFLLGMGYATALLPMLPVFRCCPQKQQTRIFLLWIVATLCGWMLGHFLLAWLIRTVPGCWRIAFSLMASLMILLWIMAFFSVEDRPFDFYLSENPINLPQRKSGRSILFWCVISILGFILSMYSYYPS